ncbi:hypothetical protein KPP23_045 [Pseudomonas phage KPP23]|nr:hypothetical protein KPP23_045 [Pseudomonas phage KPP23]
MIQIDQELADAAVEAFLALGQTENAQLLVDAITNGEERQKIEAETRKADYLEAVELQRRLWEYQEYRFQSTGLMGWAANVLAHARIPPGAGTTTFRELVDAVSWAKGSPFEADPSYFIGYQMTGINFNSLKRIVELFRNPILGSPIGYMTKKGQAELSKGASAHVRQKQTPAFCIPVYLMDRV